jgi:hypothetical protein
LHDKESKNFQKQLEKQQKGPSKEDLVYIYKQIWTVRKTLLQMLLILNRLLLFELLLLLFITG